MFYTLLSPAVIAQLGERSTEDAEVSGSIPLQGRFSSFVPLYIIYYCLYTTFISNLACIFLKFWRESQLFDMSNQVGALFEGR